MINTIIDLINDGFNDIVSDQIVVGVSQRVYRLNSDDEIEFMPGVIGNDGEIIYAGYDDIKSLNIYHKTNAANLSYGAVRTGYGDNRRNEDTIAMSLIAAWDTYKIPLQSVDMLLLLRSRMPQSIRGIKDFGDANIAPQSALLNSRQVFESEYTVAKNYFLPNNINFLQLNYIIQLKYDQTCIDTCINCSK